MPYILTMTVVESVLLDLKSSNIEVQVDNECKLLLLIIKCGC